MAGGKGTRMKSDMPKVLHPVKGIPIIERVLASVRPLCDQPTLIVGYKAEDVIAATGGKGGNNGKYSYALQKEQLGTGHAVMMAKDLLESRHDIENMKSFKWRPSSYSNRNNSGYHRASHQKQSQLYSWYV